MCVCYDSVNRKGGLFTVGALRSLQRRTVLRNLRHGNVTSNLKVSHYIISMHFLSRDNIKTAYCRKHIVVQNNSLNS